jgi:hypothetical protein
MKRNLMTINQNGIKVFFTLSVLTATIWLSSCDDGDPQKEDVPELITTAKLTFTPSGGGSVVVATATDPDGDGVKDIEVDGPINLLKNKTYTLSISLINGLASPTDDGYDITAEVEEEGDEHLFFFAWTNEVFTDPAGNGNVDNREDPLNYNDEDAGGLPLGLSTDWTTITVARSGTFRVILKHQPELKSATSPSSAGETDLDVTFNINIQ